LNVMMNILLLETLALWNGLSGGIQMGVCWIDSSMSERFFAAISSILFLSHLVLSALIYLWRDDLLIVAPSVKASYGHRHIAESPDRPDSNAQGNYHQSSDPEASQFVIDDDNEAEL